MIRRVGIVVESGETNGGGLGGMVERVEIIGFGVEVEVGAAGIGVGGRRVLGELVGFVRRRGRRRGRRRSRSHGVVVDEGVKGVTNCLEGVDVGYVSGGESVALVDCFVEKNTAISAQSHCR